MGLPAARLTDMHICPMVTPGTPPIPHVGGPISGPGAPTVLIGAMPAARMSDMAVCVGPPDAIAMGSSSVLICGLPAARMGDSTVHGGAIAMGLPTVLIGDSGGGSGGGGGGAGALGVTRTAFAEFPGKAAEALKFSLVSIMTSAGAFANAKGQAAALQTAAKNGTPLCERCAESGGKNAPK